MEHIHNTFTVSCKKSKMVSFASSVMKNVFGFLPQSRFAVKLICCTAFSSPSGVYCLLKSITISQ